jgi:hypothetical protein
LTKVFLVFCRKPVFQQKSDFHWKCSVYETGLRSQFFRHTESCLERPSVIYYNPRVNEFTYVILAPVFLLSRWNM